MAPGSPGPSLPPSPSESLRVPGSLSRASDSLESQSPDLDRQLGVDSDTDWDFTVQYAPGTCLRPLQTRRVLTFGATQLEGLCAADGTAGR